MANRQVTARRAIEDYINGALSGSVRIPHIDPSKLPQALDGWSFKNFEASLDRTVKVGDTFNCGHGLTAEVIQARHNVASGNASYGVIFYYLH